jgi:hypothetical protein
MAVMLRGEGHALLKVEMPNGKWRTFETALLPGYEIGEALYRPIVEFDENDIIYYERRSS